MGLYRKAIKSCESAISAYQFCMQAYVVQGKVYTKMNRTDQAKRCWMQGLSLLDDFSDCGIAMELESCLNGNAGANAGAAHCPGAATTRPSQVARMSQTSPSLLDTPSTSPVSEPSPPLPPAPPPQLTTVSSPPPSSHSEDTTAALQLQLALIRSHYIGEDTMSPTDTRIHPSLIASAKHTLSHASGEDLIDDLIAVTYLLVNSANFTHAIELVKMLLTYR